MGYSRSFIKGIGWNGGLKIASKVLTTIKIALLARLLSVHDFGVFSLVLVSLSVVEVFTETGINTIIVQSKKSVEYFLDTAWVISLIRGFLIALFMLVISLPLARIYDEPSLIPLIFIAALVPLVRGAINPAIITLQKNLEFRKDTFYRSSLVGADVVFTLLLALIFQNVLALILGIVCTAVFEVVVTYVLVKKHPKFHFNMTVAKEIFRQTRWLNGFAILDYLNKNLDNLLIGRILGINALGLYQNGYALTQSTTAELGLPVIHASFPVYVHISHDRQRVAAAFTKIFLGFTAVLIIPTLILCFFPAQLIHFFLGTKWDAVIPFVPVLALAGYLQGILNICSSVFVARKKFHYEFLILLVSLLTMVATIIPLSLQLGLIGSAISILVSRCSPLPILAYGIWHTLYVDEQ